METTFKAYCPCSRCGGEIVTATDKGFNATTISTTPCSKQEPYVSSVAWRKTAVVEVVEPRLQHKDGLVILG